MCKFLSQLPLHCKFLLVLLACIFIPSTGDVVATWAVSPAVPVHVNSIRWSNIVSVLYCVTQGILLIFSLMYLYVDKQSVRCDLVL